MRRGKIRGSNDGPTTGFVDLATIDAVPAEGTWTDLPFANRAAYRYVVYQLPPSSYGAVAEVELYDGSTQLDGKAFGTAGSGRGSENTYDKAFDGNTLTEFDGPLPDGNYVGLDLGATHEVAAPVFSPDPQALNADRKVALMTTTPGATIRYTLDGSDPAIGHVYQGPLALGSGAATIEAVAQKECMLDSAVSRISYGTGAAANVGHVSSIHIGNSLTDTIVDRLVVVAASAGIALDFHRYTIPGANTSWIWDHPSGGFGEADVKVSLTTNHYDIMSVQPFPTVPCTPVGDGSDADYASRLYGLARQKSPDVQLWLYQQWPSPINLDDCFASGSPWASPPWTPPNPRPATWEDAVSNQLGFLEAVRKGVLDKNPGRTVYIVPAGIALRDLKRAVDQRQVPGLSNFFSDLFDEGGTDIHLTDAGRYFVTLVFYGSMFAKSPVGLASTGLGVSAEEAMVMQQIAWSAVSNYAFSGAPR
jgi:hypothetical protein